MASNTQRTLKWLRDEGYGCDIVERYNSFTRQRKDLFGIIDIIAIKDGDMMGVQSCGQAFSAHNKKIKDSPLSWKWLDSGATLMLIGWRKVLKKRGGKQKIWAPRIKYYKKEDLWLTND